MKINASTRLLAANLPPELLNAYGFSAYRKDIARNLAHYGIDLNTAKFDPVSNDEAIRMLRGSARFGVLFCFNTERPNKTKLHIIALFKTSERRFSAVQVFTNEYNSKLSPNATVRLADVIYFVKGNEAEYNRLEEQRQERLENREFENRNPAVENRLRYRAQLAEQRKQKAVANANELLKLYKDTAIRLVQEYFDKFIDYDNVYATLHDSIRLLNNYFNENVFTDYRLDLSKIRDIAKGTANSEWYSFEINAIAVLDMNKIRSDLARLH